MICFPCTDCDSKYFHLNQEEWEEEYLETYDSGDEDGYEQKELMPERPV